MATRSRIGILNEDKMSVESVYCHWDGYLSNNGRLLNEHWKDLESVKELIRLGDLSSLGTTIQDSVFYGRDRHDIDVDAKTHSLIRWVDSGHDYEYLYTPSLGTWSYRGTGSDIRGPWVLLSTALDEITGKHEN